MNLQEVNPKNPLIAQLLKAEKAGKEFSSANVIHPCTPKKKAKEDKPAKPPVKVLYWNIQELGGGFHAPSVRPDFCIQAYANLIRAFKADLVMISGLTRFAGGRPETKGKWVQFREQTVDSGLAEVRRIASQLGGGWQMAAAMGDDGKPAYHLEQTTCFLFDASKGIRCDKVKIAACGSAFLAVAAFVIPESYDSPTELALLAPLSCGNRVPSSHTVPDPRPNASLPEAALVAFSADRSLSGDTQYRDFRMICDVEYAPPLEEGTVLKIPFWEDIAVNREWLIENHMALNPANVVLQDETMHWESLPKVSHPDKLEKVIGQLSDSILVRKTGKVGPRLENCRVTNLLRAALDADLLASLGSQPSLAEDHVIADQRKAFAAELPKSKSNTPTKHPEILFAEAEHFVRLLSDHWPILADVHLA